MSKLDAQRAMREARYAARNSSGPTRREAASGDAPAARETEAGTKPKRTNKAAPVAAAPADQGQLCGHTSMNGRSCTRPAGHSEKSHRYS